MGLSESDTRSKLIDPAIYKQGWTEEMIRREETAGAIEVVEGKARAEPYAFKCTAKSGGSDLLADFRGRLRSLSRSSRRRGARLKRRCGR